MINKVILRTDGGSRGNPGHAGIGVVIEKPDGSTYEHGSYIGKTTNNVAEYKALIHGLNQSVEMHAGSVDVFMDSELIVKQMTGVYKIKHPDMQILAGEAIKIIKNFERVNFYHVPREKNKVADGLVNKAIDEALANLKGE